MSSVPLGGIAQMTNYYLLLLFAIVSIVLSSLLRGRIIAGISSKSEVLSQLRAKEDSYTVRMEHHNGPRGTKPPLLQKWALGSYNS